MDQAGRVVVERHLDEGGHDAQGGRHMAVADLLARDRVVGFLEIEDRAVDMLAVWADEAAWLWARSCQMAEGVRAAVSGSGKRNDEAGERHEMAETAVESEVCEASFHYA